MTVKHTLPLLSLLIASLTLCACASLPSPKRAYCNTLKSQMIFSGATANTRQANIDASEKPLQQHNYDQAKCDE